LTKHSSLVAMAKSGYRRACIVAGDGRERYIIPVAGVCRGSSLFIRSALFSRPILLQPAQQESSRSAVNPATAAHRCRPPPTPTPPRKTEPNPTPRRQIPPPEGYKETGNQRHTRQAGRQQDPFPHLHNGQFYTQSSQFLPTIPSPGHHIFMSFFSIAASRRSGTAFATPTQ